MEDNWIEKEIVKLWDFGVSAPISQRIRDQLDYESSFRNVPGKVKQLTFKNYF